MYEIMVENVLYLGQNTLLLLFILENCMAFIKTEPRHHSCQWLWNCYATVQCYINPEQGLDLRYLRQGYLEEDYILDLGRVETTL